MELPKQQEKQREMSRRRSGNWGGFVPCDPGLAGAVLAEGAQSPLGLCRSCRSSNQVHWDLGCVSISQNGGFGFIWFLTQKDEFCLSPSSASLSFRAKS